MTDKQSNGKTCQLACSMAIEPEHVKLLIKVYDRITKHERANFETRLSVVGGTMGLFSGFSL